MLRSVPVFIRSLKKRNSWYIRGEPGAAGTNPLLLAYRPRELLSFLERPERRTSGAEHLLQ